MLAPNSHKPLFGPNEIACAPDRPAGRWFATSELVLVPHARFCAKEESPHFPGESMLHEGRAIWVCFVNRFISSTQNGAL